MKVVIDAIEHAKIARWIDKCDKEVSGLGLVKLINGELIVTKVYLLDQEVSSCETELSDTAIANLMYQAIQDREHGTLNFWWHSHVNMGVFWSVTDVNTKKKISKNGWFLSTVFNKKGEMKSCFNQGAGEFYPELEIDNLPTSIQLLLPDTELASLDAELALKVKETPKATHWYGHGCHGIQPYNRGGVLARVWDSDTGTWVDPAELEDDVPSEFRKRSFWEEEHGYNTKADDKRFRSEARKARKARKEIRDAQRKAGYVSGEKRVIAIGEQAAVKTPTTRTELEMQYENEYDYYL